MTNTIQPRLPLRRCLQFLAIVIFGTFVSAPALAQGSIRLLQDVMSDGAGISVLRTTANSVEIGFDRAEWVHLYDTLSHTITQVKLDLDGNVLTQNQQIVVNSAAEYGELLPLRNGSVLRVYTVSDTLLRAEQLGAFTGNVVWQYDFSTPGIDSIMVSNVFEEDDGEIVIFALVRPAGGSLTDGQVSLLRLNGDGQLLDQRQYSDTVYFSKNSALTAVLHQNQADYFLSVLIPSQPNHTNVWWKIDAVGQVVWKRTDALSNVFSPYLAQNDRLLSIGPDSLAVLDTAGALLFRVALFDSLPSNQNATFGLPILTADGGFVIPVFRVDWVPGKIYFFLKKWSATGTKLWEREFSFIRNYVELNWGIAEKPNGDLLWLGNWDHPALGYRLCWMRTDSNGILYDQRVEGRVVWDTNGDCEPGAGEPGLGQFLVQLDQGVLSFQAAANDTGVYVFPQVDAGPFTLQVVPASYVWEPCDNPVGLLMPDSTDFTLHADLATSALVNCPVMQVDIGTPFLRPCVPNTYTVRYCNTGTAIAEPAWVDVLLHPHLDFVSASAPVTPLGDTLRFLLDSVPPNTCGLFTFSVIPDCDSVSALQTICVEARIFPDTACITPAGWSGGLLRLSGRCEGDSVKFRVQNIGNGATTPGLDFIVIEDHVITRSGELPGLASGAEHLEWVAASGDTYRLQVVQEPNAPEAANPSIAVEGCNGANSLQHILAFPNVSGPPQYRQFCQEVRTSFDPNDKQAFPAGVGAEHFIEPNTWIDYQIRFQNTGNDTAFKVVLLDTLSALLDPASIRPGASSHAYTWELLDSRVLAFRFSPIALPDSTTNEPASHGFVQFRIRQQPDLPDGALLENRAGIYFDFNDVVLTNTVFHTVSRDFLPTVSTYDPNEKADAALFLYPNPARNAVFAFLKTEQRAGGTFTLFDALGRVLWSEKCDGRPTTEIRRRGLPAGVYGLRWESAQGEVFMEKIVWQ